MSRRGRRHQRQRRRHWRLPLIVFLGRCEARIGLCLRQFQRNGARFEHGVVEPANVECLAECLLRLVTQLADFKAANHVRRRLTGVDDIAFDGFHDAAGGVCRVILDIFDRLFTRLAFVLQTAVYH